MNPVIFPDAKHRKIGRSQCKIPINALTSVDETETLHYFVVLTIIQYFPFKECSIFASQIVK